MSLLTSQYTNVHAGYHHELHEYYAVYCCSTVDILFCINYIQYYNRHKENKKNYGTSRRRFWHATLRLRSAIRRHHPPQRAVLSQICSGSTRWCCFRSCWTVLTVLVLEKKCIQLSWVKVGLISYDNEAPVHATCTTLDVMYIIGMMEQTSDTANQLQNTPVLVLIASS